MRSFIKFGMFAILFTYISGQDLVLKYFSVTKIEVIFNNELSRILQLLVALLIIFVGDITNVKVQLYSSLDVPPEIHY